ncbi:MAG: type II secretion system F family protein [Pseudomonadota bacterium]
MSGGLFVAVITAAVLLAGLTLVLLGYLGMRARQDRQLERRVLGAEVIRDEFDDSADAAPLKLLARSGQRIEKLTDDKGETARLLLQAGWRGAQARVLFYAFRSGMLLLAGLLSVLVWTFGSGVKATTLPMFIFAFFALGFLIPIWVLRAVAGARRERMAREVPLFIHLLVLLFEAGLSTRQAFASLVREGRGVLPELGQEFEGVLRQLEAGGDIADVLKGMTQSLEIAELEGVFGVLRQVDKYGGEIREPLMEALAVLEERRGIDLREKVNLTSGRMTVVMVLFFFPALLIFVAGPAVVSILKAMADVAGGK